MFSRREFLKLTAVAGFNLAFPEISWKNSKGNTQKKQNILIVVMDALSAYHLSIYGYQRETMPNLSRLVKRAIVYHSHYSGGNYTTPGTASILTGTLPWTHRAVVHNDVVSDEFINKNIFSIFPDYFRFAYSHNILVNTQLQQFFKDINVYTPRKHLFLGNDSYFKGLFSKDDDIASVSWVRALKKVENGYSYSLYFSRLHEVLKNNQIKEQRQDYPRGLPSVNVDEFYVLEESVDFLIQQLDTIPRPFLGYYHFLPPHEPYNPSSDFVGYFNSDGYRILDKENHLFSQGKSYDFLNKNSNNYDEFILYADHEFSRLYDHMERNGMLDDTLLVFTSDHGELFERGIIGHSTPVLHQPIIRVPLVIFEPGRNDRLDITEPTSGMDILPTLLSVSKKALPAWIEGGILPPFNSNAIYETRDLFAIQVKGDIKNDPISKGTIMMVRGDYKLIYYFGYKELEKSGKLIELFDISIDPNELNNLYPKLKTLGDEMAAVIESKLVSENSKYI